jgi:hypothetical protein
VGQERAQMLTNIEALARCNCQNLLRLSLGKYQMNTYASQLQNRNPATNHPPPPLHLALPIIPRPRYPHPLPRPKPAGQLQHKSPLPKKFPALPLHPPPRYPLITTQPITNSPINQSTTSSTPPFCISLNSPYV